MTHAERIVQALGSQMFTITQQQARIEELEAEIMKMKEQIAESEGKPRLAIVPEEKAG